ncbi:MAG: hypothetical protein GSR80_000273 [Desulfurococcales archaeon]|nr:hypothetical protein [Desulfurococcales archaeon]
MGKSRGRLIGEALLLLFIAGLAMAGFHAAYKHSQVGQGFTCQGGGHYKIGPGSLTLSYSYSDTLCGLYGVHFNRTISLGPGESCLSPPGEVMAFDAHGHPVLPGARSGYASVPLGVRPAYVYERQGVFAASACMPIPVQGRVVAYYDKETGVLLKATAYVELNGHNYAVRELDLRGYTINSGGSSIASSPLWGLLYAATIGVSGATIAIAVKKLLEAL